MMRTWLVAASICAIVTTIGRAQNQPPIPKSAPPAFAFVHDLDKSQNLVFVRTIEYLQRAETRTVPEIVERNGQKFQLTKQVTVMVVVPVTSVTKWDAGKGTAINGAGNKLSREELFQQLRAGDTIMTYSGDLDQAFLKLLKDNVVLIQMQASSAVIPAMGPEPIPGPKK
jgi:hypothetical protein